MPSSERAPCQAGRGDDPGLSAALSKRLDDGWEIRERVARLWSPVNPVPMLDSGDGAADRGGVDCHRAHEQVAEHAPWIVLVDAICRRPASVPRGLRDETRAASAAVVVNPDYPLASTRSHDYRFRVIPRVGRAGWRP
jgi:hypothetical protein